MELQDALPSMKTLEDLACALTQIDKKAKDKPIVVHQVAAMEEKCPEIAFAGPQNQLQKAVEDQKGDRNGEEMQPGPSTCDVKQTNKEQAKESFLAILSKEWLQLVQKRGYNLNLIMEGTNLRGRLDQDDTKKLGDDQENLEKRFK
uniref:Uncharacterized protein n=1 Tax=Romanomermis culicivorax TaxID=13658 RepID=A0A915JTI9_ROMCU